MPVRTLVQAGPPEETPVQATQAPSDAHGATVAHPERTAIISALRQVDNRVSGRHGAAAILGVKATTLHTKMKKLGVRCSDVLRA